MGQSRQHPSQRVAASLAVMVKKLSKLLKSLNQIFFIFLITQAILFQQMFVMSLLCPLYLICRKKTLNFDIFALSKIFMSTCYQENTKKKNANDLYYKTLIIGVIVLTCKSKLSLLTSVNFSCLLRLFSPQNWVPHKSTILLREIIWGQTSFSGSTTIQQTYNHKNTFIEPL